MSRATTTAIALLFALALGACGDADEGAGGDAGAPPPAATQPGGTAPPPAQQ